MSFTDSSKIIENIGHSVLSFKRTELPAKIDGTITFIISSIGKSQGKRAKTIPLGSKIIFFVILSFFNTISSFNASSANSVIV